MNRDRRQAGQSSGQHSGSSRALIPSSIAARGGRYATRCVALSSATERARPHAARHMSYATRCVALSSATERARPHAARRMPPPRAAGPRGFTMIEMLIVIVIVSVLLMVGLPAYRKQVIQGNRAEGTGALLRIMDRQERYYANNFPPTYASSMTRLGFASTYLTENKRYSIDVDNCTGSTDFKSCVKLTATPTAQGGQTNDGDLTLNSRGEKTRCGKTGWEHLEGCP